MMLMNGFLTIKSNSPCPYCERFPVGFVVGLMGDAGRFSISCTCKLARELPPVDLSQLDELDTGDIRRIWDGSRLDIQRLYRRAQKWIDVVAGEVSAAFGGGLDGD